MDDNSIKILDCTLRDGGYLNNWRFGKNNIAAVIGLLAASGIDYIECGFFTPNIKDMPNSTLFSNLQRFVKTIREIKGTEYTLMLNYNNDLKNIKNYEITLRVAFKKQNLIEIKSFCEELKNKGYKIILNPMHTIGYTEKELDKLICICNLISPQCFTVVDTMGIMSENDTEKLFCYLDKNISSEISFGFHSHNNLRLSFKNVKILTELKLKREIIIDTCIFGLGRGAGIVPTELIAGYLNKNFKTRYHLENILKISDKYLYKLKTMYMKDDKYPYYLSALNKCHPYYAKYLKDNTRLNYAEMNIILANIPNSNKTIYNESIIRNLFSVYNT